MRLDVLSQLLDNDFIIWGVSGLDGRAACKLREDEDRRDERNDGSRLLCEAGGRSGGRRAEIEAALKRMQPVWSMGTRNPKTRHANQLYLDEIPALRKALLSDPASRAAYDAELAMVQVAERDRKLDFLLRRVNLRAAKGGLTATDRRLLGEEATKLGLSDEDLLRLTRPIPDLVETARQRR